jgi:hypothetical protein
MDFALVEGETLTELTPERDVRAGDVVIPWGSLVMWSEQERAAFGIYEITREPVPRGKIPQGSTVRLIDGLPVRQWDGFVDVPPALDGEIS